MTVMQKSKKSVLGMLGLFTLVSGTSSVRADLLTDWNLVVTGDAYVKHETEGPVRIGGDLNLADRYYGIRPQAGTLTAPENIGLIVGGNINNAELGGIKLDNGANALIGGTENTLSQFSLNGNSAQLGVASIANIGVSDALLLQQYSDGFKGMTANNAFAIQNGNEGLFKVTGRDALGNAVFNVSASQVFGNSSLGSLILDLNNQVFGIGQSVVINVSGAAVSMLGGRNFNGDFDVPGANSYDKGNPNVIWNFYEAETFDMANGNFKGALLANNAVLTNTNTIDGSVFVKQLGTTMNPGFFDGQDGEVHPPLYQGYVPKAIPEPASIVMAAIAVTAGAAFSIRRRRRNSA